MKVNFWMTNVNVGEVPLTKKFLVKQGASDLTVDEKAIDGPEYEWSDYCDSEDDIWTCLSYMLFYNDRAPETIAKFEPEFKALLAKYRR